jgi:hypothetical protein
MMISNSGDRLKNDARRHEDTEPRGDNSIKVEAEIKSDKVFLLYQ